MSSGRNHSLLIGSGLESGGQRQVVAPAPDWVAEIQRVWAEGGANTLKLANVVCAARARLHRGQWTELFRSDRIPFSLRKAKMLVAIGQGLGWANGQTFARLPRGWSILYWLARIDRSDLERLMRDGTVHPHLKLREVKDLVARLSGQRPATSLKSPDVSRRLHNFARFVDSTLDEWSWRQRRFAATKLREIAAQVENDLSQPRVLGQPLFPTYAATPASVPGRPAATQEFLNRIPSQVSI